MKIKTIISEPYVGTVHNFETVNTHTYFVNNVLVHNCHESATIKGKHGDLVAGLALLSQLPAGSEVAIGGGNPLSHPGIESFLEGLQRAGVVANMTMNQLHFKQYGTQMKDLLSRKLIHGLGISYNADNSLDVVKPVLEATDNEVFHLIIGIHTVDDLEKLYAFRKPLKVLLLGYKEFGRGVDYHAGKSDEITRNITRWYQQLPRFFKQENLIISFDNLAIKQLNVKRFFTDEGWEKFYMGDDSTFTFYIDLVAQKYGASSTAPVRYDLKPTMLETFGSIKQPVLAC